MLHLIGTAVILDESERSNALLDGILRFKSFDKICTLAKVPVTFRIPFASSGCECPPNDGGLAVSNCDVERRVTAQEWGSLQDDTRSVK